MVQRARRLTGRGARTRAKILDGTINCIVRSGFASMTVENVIAEAGVSRGSLLHQFPTRTDLAVETARYALDLVLESSRRLAAKYPDPFERLREFAHIVWEIHLSREGQALTEILQAARWDNGLSAELRPHIEGGDELVRRDLEAMARAAGVIDPASIVPYIWRLSATARGLSLESGMTYMRPVVVAAVESMSRDHRYYCDSLPRKPVVAA